MNNRIVIIGGGHGGAQICASLRQFGYQGKITLVSRDSCLPYHRPPLSKAFLKDPTIGTQIIKPKAFYDDNAIDLALGKTVIEIDLSAHHIKLDDGELIEYSKLVLSTGSVARKLVISGQESVGVHYLKIAKDAENLRADIAQVSSVSVIGGGFIGLEAAVTFAGLGKKVTVYEAGNRLLGRAVSPEISEYFLNKHRSNGIDIKLDANVQAISKIDGKVAGVICDDKETKTDVVLVGIGVNASCELAENAGLECDNGILVDGHMQTSDKDVLAIGDCVSFKHWQTGTRLRLESVQNANDQARNAALSLVGKKQEYREVPWFWSDQGVDKLQIVGLSTGSDQRIVRHDFDASKISVYHYKSSRMVAIDTVNNPAEHMIGRRLLAGSKTPAPAEISADGFSLRGYLKNMS